MYFQDTAADWPQWVAKLPNNFSIIAVDRGDILKEARQHNPGVFTILRHWNDNYQWTNDWQTAKQLARDWFNSFIDQTFKEQYAPYVMAVTERNEYDSHVLPPAERVMRILWMQAVSQVWNTEYKNQLQQYRPGLPPIQLVLGENAVGNDLPREAAVAAIDSGDLLGYHGYLAVYGPVTIATSGIVTFDNNIPFEPTYRANFREGNLPYRVPDAPMTALNEAVGGQPSPNEFEWASGRWHYMEQAWGLKPTWVFGEFGPIRDASGTGWLQPNDGWRHPGVCGSDVNALIGLLNYWLNNTKTTPAYQEGRIRGFHLFTTPGNAPWQMFKFQQPEMNTIADWVKANWKPGTIVIPPPPSTRVKGPDISRWNSPIDAAKMKSKGAEFCFVKATEHTTWTDPKYSENVFKLSAVNIPYSPYHFYRDGHDPIAQAEFFYNTIIASGQPDMPFMLDVEIPPAVTSGSFGAEGSGRVGLGEPLVGVGEIAAFIGSETILTFADDVRQCLMHIQSLSGKRPILYTNKYFYDTYLAQSDLDEVADLHIAQWTTASNPTIPGDYTTWHFWQYTNSGNGPDWGVSSARVDLNYFNGDEQMLQDYIGSTPPPPPPPAPIENLFRNPSFEDGHYTFVHPNGTVYGNILVPNEWWFRFAGPSVPNEYNSDPENIYQQPEMAPLHKSQLPESEWPLFIWDGDYTVKLFSGQRAWRTKLMQTPDNPVDGGQFAINLFVDCYTDIVNGQKVWATDPDTCLVVPEVNGIEWGPRLRLAPGQRHSVEWEIDANIATIGLKIFAPFATLNNGVFLDAWELRERDTEPFPEYPSSVSLIPPRATSAQLQTIRTFADTNKETVAYSQHDCVKLATSGLPGLVRVWYLDSWDYDIEDWLIDNGVTNIEFLP